MKQVNEVSALRTLQTVISALAASAQTTYQNVAAAVMYCQLAGIELGFRFIIRDGGAIGDLADRVNELIADDVLGHDDRGNLVIKSAIQGVPVMPDPTVSEVVTRVANALPMRSPERMHYFLISMVMLQDLLDLSAQETVRAKLLTAIVGGNHASLDNPLLEGVLAGDPARVEALREALAARDGDGIRDNIALLLPALDEDTVTYAFNLAYDGTEQGDDFDRAEQRVVAGCRIVAGPLQYSVAQVISGRRVPVNPRATAAERAGQLSFGF